MTTQEFETRRQTMVPAKRKKTAPFPGGVRVERWDDMTELASGFSDEELLDECIKCMTQDYSVLTPLQSHIARETASILTNEMTFRNLH